MNRIDWKAMAVPPRPVPDVFARMARLTLAGHDKPTHEEFALFLDQWDAQYFWPATADAIDNRRGAK
jgi:hypothetical protein